MRVEEIAEELAETGMCGADVIATTKHLLYADELGIHDQGVARIPWLKKMRFYPADPIPERIEYEELPLTRHTFRVKSSNRIGYAMMEAAVQIPFERTSATVQPMMVTVENCFPSGALGIWARDLAVRGYASIITATSPPRVPHPGGQDRDFPKLGTTPLSVCIPGAPGDPLVADMALTDRTYGDVLNSVADESMLRFPNMKMWALGIALETMVRSMTFADNTVLMILFRPVLRDAVRKARSKHYRLPGHRS